MTPLIRRHDPDRAVGFAPRSVPDPSRRLLVRGAVVAFALTAATVARATSRTPLPGYTAWRRLFVQGDGRVVDVGQNRASTSESQGYGMVLALASGDLAGFETIWAWTQKNLAVRADGLLAWHWLPGKGVTDANNAADGDLVVAWALAQAARIRPALAEPARQLAQAIRQHLLRDTPWGTVLLPAVQGFETPKGQVVNLSYWVFPALPSMQRIDPSPQWAALQESGLKLLRIARFGRWGLPPDWLLLVNPLVPDRTRPGRYGYEAVRIPLYLQWGGLASAELLAPFKAFWQSFRCESYLPGWTNFADDSIDSFSANSGMRAIRDWIENSRAPTVDPDALARDGYYSAVLTGLVQAAARGALQDANK